MWKHPKEISLRFQSSPLIIIPRKTKDTQLEYRVRFQHKNKLFNSEKNKKKEEGLESC